MFPYVSDDDGWVIAVLALVLLVGVFWWWNRGAKKWLEENDRLEPESNALDWLLGRQQQNPKATTLRYSEQEFREMISKVLDELPEEFDKEWKNVVVVHSTEWPADSDKKRMAVPEGHIVFGTYTGRARTTGIRSNHSQHVIVIYQPALELLCGADKERLESEIRRTVLHELAHYLGISHAKMKEIGL